MRGAVAGEGAGDAELGGAATGIVVGGLRRDGLTVVVAANDDDLLWVRRPWHADLDIGTQHDARSVAPASGHEGVAAHLRGEPYQIARHLGYPVGGELVVPVRGGGEVIVKASLPGQVGRRPVRKLVVHIIGIYAREVGGCRTRRRAARRPRRAVEGRAGTQHQREAQNDKHERERAERLAARHATPPAGRLY